MCGLVGMVALNGAAADSQAIERMSAVLLHRGPDGQGTYISGAVGFGFRRLSILDLSPTGNQPMSSPDGQTVLVFNGEIFNYVELRQELETLGHEFTSTGDTEVLLHAYLEWGRECLNRLNGMWGFLIYDVRRGKIFGSRDRFGEKPLYRYRCGDYIFFSSEIKAILASGYYRGGPNWNVASRFLLQGSLDPVGRENETFYADIEQLPAGSAFELDLKGHFNEWRFWSLPKLTDQVIKNPAESFYEIFEDALRLRLRSDVPVGLFLSGGLDSTSIACGWAKINDDGPHGPMLAFSYQPDEYDETVYINDTVKQTGVKLIQFQSDPRELWDRFERLLWYQDEPVHSLSAMITFELTRLASESGVKVILNGGAADEFLAGYHNYFTNYWCTLLRAGRVREVWREIRAYCLGHRGDAWTFYLNFLYHQYKAELGRIPAARKLARRTRHRKLQKHPWFTTELSDHLTLENGEYTEPTLDSTLKRSVEQSPLPLYLRIEDRNSMAHSVESRMPFLDYRLVSLAFQLPANWKMNGPWNKYVLREAMRGRIPESVRSRLDKFGFPVPAKNWFANGLYEPMQDLLGSREVRERGLYNVGAIRRDLELHRQGKVDMTGPLFNVAQFEIWSKLERVRSKFSSHVPIVFPKIACGARLIPEVNSIGIG